MKEFSIKNKKIKKFYTNLTANLCLLDFLLKAPSFSIKSSNYTHSCAVTLRRTNSAVYTYSL